MSGFLQYMPKSQMAAIEFIKTTFPNRFTAISGTSGYSVTKFIDDNPGFICDVVFIDGCHEFQPPFTDITNFRKLANDKAIVLLDDLEFPQVRQAVDLAVTNGLISPLIECIEGEVLVDQRFSPGVAALKRPGKKFCQTKFK